MILCTLVTHASCVHVMYTEYQAQNCSTHSWVLFFFSFLISNNHVQVQMPQVGLGPQVKKGQLTRLLFVVVVILGGGGPKKMV